MLRSLLAVAVLSSAQARCDSYCGNACTQFAARADTVNECHGCGPEVRCGPGKRGYGANTPEQDTAAEGAERAASVLAKGAELQAKPTDGSDIADVGVARREATQLRELIRTLHAQAARDEGATAAAEGAAASAAARERAAAAAAAAAVALRATEQEVAQRRLPAHCSLQCAAADQVAAAEQAAAEAAAAASSAAVTEWEQLEPAHAEWSAVCGAKLGADLVASLKADGASPKDKAVTAARACAACTAPPAAAAAEQGGAQGGGRPCAWCSADARCVADRAWACGGGSGAKQHTGQLAGGAARKACPSVAEAEAEAEGGEARRAALDGVRAAFEAKRAAAAAAHATARQVAPPGERATARWVGETAELRRVAAELAAEGAVAGRAAELAARRQRAAGVGEGAQALSLSILSRSNAAGASSFPGGGDGSAEWPYRTLGVKRLAPGSAIRAAYAVLAPLLSPAAHAASGPDAGQADAAFADVAAAMHLVGDNADRRESWDAWARQEAAESGAAWLLAFDEHLAVEEDADRLYVGDPYVVSLTERTWGERVGAAGKEASEAAAAQGGADAVWLVEFYAPWCGHCQSLKSQWSAAAKALAEGEPAKAGGGGGGGGTPAVPPARVEFGAVNCAHSGNAALCQAQGVSSYPTVKALCPRHGLSLDYPKTRAKGAAELAEWARGVGEEWRWLIRHANVAALQDSGTFNSTVLASDEFWVVIFLDGTSRPIERIASDNARRLSAGLRGLARVGVVDCSRTEESKALCYGEHAVQPSPHPPTAKAWRRGDKRGAAGRAKGETLYNAAMFSPHVALGVLERAVRLALAVEKAAMLAEGTAFAAEVDEEEEAKKKKEAADAAAGGEGASPPPTRFSEEEGEGTPVMEAIAWGGETAPDMLRLG